MGDHIRNCADCGVDISSTPKRTKRCPACAAERTKRMQREKMRAKRLDPEFREKENARAREYAREYYKRPEVRERVRGEERKAWVREYTRRRYQEDAEYREQVLEWGKESRKRRMQDPVLADKERERQKLKERRRSADPETKAHILALRRKNRARPEVRARERMARRLRKPWDDTVTQASLEALLAAQKSRCAACGASLEDGYHMDHILPQVKGGASTLANLQLLCQRCNSSKHARLYYDGKDGQMLMALGVGGET